MRDKLSTAIVANKRGGPEVFRVLHPPIPKPGPGQIQIKMLAAGVAFADIMVREGTYPLPENIGWPRTPGYDVVGEIQALGNGVEGNLQVGQRVAAMTVYGSYARHRLLSAAQCLPVPEGVDHAEAVALVLNYLTAWQMLHRVAKVKNGQYILIHAAAGGVGTALLDLAALHGVKAIGVASAHKHPTIRERGGIPVDRQSDIEIEVRRICGDHLAAVFDPVGGRTTHQGLKLLQPGGTLVCFGVLGSHRNGRPSLRQFIKSLPYALRASPLKLLLDSKGLVGYNVDTWRRQNPEYYREDLTTLFNLLAEGRIRPLIAERIPLEEAARAQELLGNGETKGKLVLV